MSTVQNQDTGALLPCQISEKLLTMTMTREENPKSLRGSERRTPKSNGGWNPIFGDDAMTVDNDLSTEWVLWALSHSAFWLEPREATLMLWSCQFLIFFEFFLRNFGVGAPGGDFWVLFKEFRVSGFWIPVAGRAFRKWSRKLSLPKRFKGI